MKGKKSLLARVRAYFEPGNDTVTPKPGQRLRLSGKGIRIPLTGQPFVVEMGKQSLHLYPVRPLVDGGGQGAGDFLLVAPERYFSGIGHFLRLSPGAKIAIDPEIEEHGLLFSHPRDAFRRNFQVSHEGDALVFRDPISELGTYVSLLPDGDAGARLGRRRTQALEKVSEIFGGPIRQLPPNEALDTIQRVNALLLRDQYRRTDTDGNPGGLVELPDHLTPIVVGDLHGREDNLLTVLSENAFMQELEAGRAALVILGDAIHREDDGALDSMESSALVMDLILKLKLRFASQVIFVLGNHDSFSRDVMKCGVPQSVIWDKYLTEVRGEVYREQMALFYRYSPLAVASEAFIACHAGPCRAKVSREMLVDVRRFPGLTRELTCTRAKTPLFPAGYTQGDVRRFRKSLGVADDTPFLVGHYPLTPDGTVWRDVSQIRRHHIVYSARADRVGLFTRIDGQMAAQVYPCEPLRDWINQRG